MKYCSQETASSDKSTATEKLASNISHFSVYLKRKYLNNNNNKNKVIHQKTITNTFQKLR